MKYFLQLLIVFAVVVSSCNNNQQTSESTTENTLNLADSIQLLSDQIRQNPYNAELFIKRSDCQFQNGNLDEAINDVEIAIKVDSLKPPYFTKLASLYMLKSNGSEQAKQILNKCINRFPNFPDAHIDLARIYLYVGMFQEALQEIQYLELKNLQNGDSYFTRGMILYRATEVEQNIENITKWKRDAVAAFKKCIEYDAENWEAYNKLSTTLTELDDKLALEYFRTAETKFPDNQEIKYWYGWSLLYFEKYEEAKDKFLVAATMDSISYWTFLSYAELGDMYSTLSDEPDCYKTAIDYYTKALNCDTTHYETYTKRGDAYAKNKMINLAENDYRKALSLATNYEPAIAGLNKIGR